MQSSEKSAAVSIVIPCYNQVEFLAECLSSIAAQSFRDWRAIVVDDASTKGDVAQVVTGFADPRMQVVKHPSNRGLGAARNTGFRAAQSSLVLALDSDDKLDPSFLQVTVDALERSPEADCVFTDFRLFGTSDVIWRNRIKSARDMLLAQWIPGPGTLMRKRVWEGVGGYAEMRQPYCGNEDWDFWIAAVRRGLHPIHVPQAMYLYRRGPQSMSLSTMAYHDHAMREMIYQRQKAFFDEYLAGGRFRARGYFNSARAAVRRGEALRAATMLARACRLLLQPTV